MIIQMRSFGYNIRIHITFLFPFIVLFSIADLLCRQIVVSGNDSVDAVVSCNAYHPLSFLKFVFATVARDL